MKIKYSTPLIKYGFDDESICFPDSLFIKKKQEQPDFYQRMFNDDFTLTSLSRHQQKNKYFDIKTNNEELTQKLISNINTEHEQYSIDEKIFTIIEEISQTLIWFESACYFIFDEHNQDRFHIQHLNSEGIINLRWICLQFIPKRTIKNLNDDRKTISRELRILNKSKIIFFNTPKKINRLLSQQNRILNILDKYKIDSALSLSQIERKENKFNFGAWKNMQELALYRATKKTGWNGRNGHSLEHSDFFVCHRLIRFRRNQLTLRDHILLQLSTELTRIGQAYSLGFHVDISPSIELPKVAELDELENRLSKEEVSFTEVINFCYKR